MTDAIEAFLIMENYSVYDVKSVPVLSAESPKESDIAKSKTTETRNDSFRNLGGYEPVALVIKQCANKGPSWETTLQIMQVYVTYAP